MFGHRYGERRDMWMMARGRGGGGGRCGPGRGWGGPGFFDEDAMNARRKLLQGDLRLVTLDLIAKEPAHGYEIIRRIEEMTAGWYSPSPGVIYPTLTYLEEAGQLSATTEGTKKLYTITTEGQTHLAENREVTDLILKRLAWIGEKAARARDAMHGEESGGRPRLPRAVEAAALNLREVIVTRLETQPGAETDIVEALLRLAREVGRTN